VWINTTPLNAMQVPSTNWCMGATWWCMSRGRIQANILLPPLLKISSNVYSIYFYTHKASLLLPFQFAPYYWTQPEKMIRIRIQKLVTDIPEVLLAPDGLAPSSRSSTSALLQLAHPSRLKDPESPSKILKWDLFHGEVVRPHRVLGEKRGPGFEDGGRAAAAASERGRSRERPLL
jgi:hypothetical protein